MHNTASLYELQYALHGAALEAHSEASTDSECSSLGTEEHVGLCHVTALLASLLLVGIQNAGYDLFSPT